MSFADAKNSRRCALARRGQCGSAVVELALMSPWLIVLFMVVLDLGMYSYAAIATQNAARSGVMWTSKSSSYVTDTTGACQIARRELRGMPNVPLSLATCAANKGAISDANPIAVETAAIPGPDATTLGAAQVVVTFRTPQLFLLPGLMGRMTLTRIAEARVRDN